MKAEEIEQYRQCHESIRHHDRLILQELSIQAIIVSAIMVAAFRYLYSSPRIQIILLCVGALISFCLSVAVFKNRYFSEIEQGTLSKMEQELKLNLIQRTTKPEKQLKESKLKEFWYYKSPKKKFGIANLSAHWLLMGCSFIIFITMLALSIYKTVLFFC